MKNDISNGSDWHFTGHCWVSFGAQELKTAYSFVIQYHGGNSMITDSQVFTKVAKIPWRVIDDEAVIVDLEGNSVLQLNDVGRHIWERIDGTAQVAIIVDTIVEEYDVERDAAQSDVFRFFNTLVEKRLIDEVSP